MSTEEATRNLRILIDQLQQNARDARTHAQSAEQEKERFSQQLEDAFAELHTARDRETELRSRFAETTALLKERDTAVALSDRYVRTISELQRQLDAAKREHQENSRSGKNTAQQTDSATKAARAAAAQLADTQKQVVSIRLARDAAQAQVHALVDKLAAAEDQIAELGYACAAAPASGAAASSELSDLRQQFAALTSERDALVDRVDELTAKVDEQARRIAELDQEQSAAAEAANATTAALEEAREQFAAVTLERDQALARGDESEGQLNQIRQEVEMLREQQSLSRGALEELEEARRQLSSLAAEREAQLERERELVTETTAKDDRLAALEVEIAAACGERDEVLLSLADVQNQAGQLASERDQARAEAQETAITVEAQLLAVRTRNEELEAQVGELQRQQELAARKSQADAELASRFERQRLETIELGSRFAAAQREIIELTAGLAEARLQSRHTGPPAPRLPRARAGQAAPVAPPAEAPPNAQVVAPTAQSPAPDEPLTERGAMQSLSQMRDCFGAFLKSPAEAHHLNELHSQAHRLGESARTSGYIALHRLLDAFCALAHELSEFPEAVNASTTRTISQTIEFLMLLVREKHVSQLTDPAQALIYAVDDDLLNCQAIVMGMERAGLRTTYCQEPAVALGELAGRKYDLVFLDVNMAEMNGFELCAHIRELPEYVETPVVFLTGMASLENRMQSSLSGGTDLIAKPFDLHELSVKALTYLLKAQIQARVAGP